MNEEKILEVRHLKRYFEPAKNYEVKAVDDVSFEIKKGEVLGLVGESGCGKSTVLRTIMGVYPPTEGEIYFKGNQISDKKVFAQKKKEVQQKMQVIFQDSASALNPRMKVEEIIAEPALVNHIWRGKKQIQNEVGKLLKYVGLEKEVIEKYPDELSGGQRQRVAVARSISLKPDLILADEPVASLDVSVQAQIINLFSHLKKEHNSAFLFVAHDLALVRYLCDKVAVMHQGKIVEMGKTEEIFLNPKEEYTKKLLDAILVPDPIFERKRRRR